MYMYNKVERLLWLSHYLMVVQLKQSVKEICLELTMPTNSN